MLVKGEGGDKVFDGTHNFWSETGTVGKMGDRVIEVVKVGLVLGLELMKEAEEFEGKDGVWSE